MKAYLQNGVFRAILALISMLLIFLYFFATTFIEIPENTKVDTTMLNGAFIGIVGAIIGYYFGGMDKSQSLPVDDKTN
jgi:hypothetical protein